MLVVAGSLIWSLGALTNRWTTHSDAFQYLVWRSVGVLVVVELLGQHRSARRPGRRSPTLAGLGGDAAMWVVTISLFFASFGFVYALKNTTATNAAFFSSLSPLVGAVLGWVVLRERPSRVVAVAVVLAIIGVVVTATAATVRGDGNVSSWNGNIAALTCSVAFAVYMVALRTDRTRDWGPAMPAYAAIMIVVCGAVTVAQGRPLFPGVRDVALAVFHGAVLIVVGTLLFNRATKVVPVVALSLLAQTETVAVPIWIFLFFGERPSARGVVGAALLLVSAVLPVVGMLSRARVRSGAPAG